MTDSLEALNAELLAALKDTIDRDDIDNIIATPVLRRARTIIAKCEALDK